MHKPTAIYVRVSSDRQKEWVFQDEGYSGAILVRPGSEAARFGGRRSDRAVPVYAPDRLSRQYAYQVWLSEELSRLRSGVDLSESAGWSHSGGSVAGDALRRTLWLLVCEEE